MAEMTQVEGSGKGATKTKAVGAEMISKVSMHPPEMKDANGRFLDFSRCIQIVEFFWSSMLMSVCWRWIF